MAKVGILTFHWADDFGAMLQAYGLKKYLMDCGHEVTIIPYSNSNLDGRYRLLPKQPDFPDRKLFVGDYNLWEMARNIKHLRTFILRRNRMKYFRKKYLVDKNFIVRHRQLDTTQYDAIIIGSDQVWNPEITVGLNRTYLGNFKIRKDSKVISYAVSIGGDCLTHKDAVELGRNIDDNFSAVSVREESARAFLQDFATKAIKCVPDPTLLNDKKAWHDILSREKPAYEEQQGSYIVFHSTEYGNTAMADYTRKLSLATGLKVINLRDGVLGPVEFLRMISNADYVITNSFHVTVFSILFERRFVVFNHSSKNARLVDLLESLGLDERISDCHELESIDKPIDWNVVVSRMTALQDRGRIFLRENI